MAKKFLIIRFSSIGDIVLTTPVIRCLKQQAAGAEIHFLTKKSFRSILEGNPYISKLHLLEDDLNALLPQLKGEKFDHVIDLHNNLRTMQVKRFLKVPHTSFNKLNIQKWLLTNFKVNRMPAIHIVDRNLQTVQQFGVRNDGEGLDYFIPEKDEADIHQLPLPHQFGYIGLVIGAALHTKKLPLQKLQELCSIIDHPIVLLGGPEDRANGELLEAIDHFKIYNACGKFNLNQSASLVQQAKVIISHDTGLMHIAAAFKKPVVSIWGNTVPEFGMGPYYGQHMVNNYIFQVPNKKVSQPSLNTRTTIVNQPGPDAHLACRPCSKIGHDACPKKHFRCMNDQSMEAVKDAVLNLIRSAAL